MGLALDPLSIVAILIIGTVVLWGIRIFKNRMDQQRYLEELAELEFTESLLAESALNEGTNEAFLMPDKDSALPPAPVEQALDFYSNVNSDPAAADQKASGIINQLTHSGMFNSIDGYVELHGNKKGSAIIKLRNGKLALLVPHMESEAFIKRQSRRVDYIIMTMSDGTGMVVTPLEQLISENIMPG